MLRAKDESLEPPRRKDAKGWFGRPAALIPRTSNRAAQATTSRQSLCVFAPWRFSFFPRRHPAYRTFAVTAALPRLVNAPVLVLAPPLEQAPDHVAVRPLAIDRSPDAIRGHACDAMAT